MDSNSIVSIMVSILCHFFKSFSRSVKKKMKKESVICTTKIKNKKNERNDAKSMCLFLLCLCNLW